MARSAGMALPITRTRLWLMIPQVLHSTMKQHHRGGRQGGAEKREGEEKRQNPAGLKKKKKIKSN